MPAAGSGECVSEQPGARKELPLCGEVLFVPMDTPTHLGNILRFPAASVRAFLKKHLVTHYVLELFQQRFILVPEIKRERRCPTKQPIRGWSRARVRSVDAKRGHLREGPVDGGRRSARSPHHCPLITPSPKSASPSRTRHLLLPAHKQRRTES